MLTIAHLIFHIMLIGFSVQHSRNGIIKSLSVTFMNQIPPQRNQSRDNEIGKVKILQHIFRN